MIINKNKIRRDSLELKKIHLRQISILPVKQRGVLMGAILQFANADDLPEMDASTEVIFNLICEDLQKSWDIEDKRRQKISDSWVERKNKQ